MFTITCESTVDLPLEYLKKRNCDAVCYSYFIGTEERVDHMQNTPETLEKFYKDLEEYKPTTSQIGGELYKDFFRAHLSDGNLLHLAFGSGMSQSVFNAMKAADEINAEVGKKVITVIDTTCSCIGYGLIVDTALDMRDNGATEEEIIAWMEQNKRRVHHQFFSTTLSYFKRSGRVSWAAAFLGNLLRLCPIMHLNNDGKIIANSKAMSVSKAIDKTMDEIAAHIENGGEYSGKLWISHSNCIQTAEKVMDKLKQAYPAADIRLFDIGPIIACHCGPGTVAIFFMGDDRKA